MSTSPNYIARGNISPCTIVIQDTSTDFGVLVSGANGLAIGVAQEGVKGAPIPGASAYAAVSGDLLRVYGPGEQCLVLLGGTVTAGDKIKSDANGAGVTSSTYDSATVKNIIGLALESGVSGEKIRMLVQIEIF